jgi:hypothetical protein
MVWGCFSCDSALPTEDETRMTEAEEGTGGTTPSIPPAGGDAIQVEVLPVATTGVSLFVERRREVIRDQGDWEPLWSLFSGNLQPSPSLPPVDFGQSTVIVAAMGRKPTGGYGIGISQVAVEGDTLYVTVVETSPGPLCSTIQVNTSPAVAVKLNRTGAPVIFLEEGATDACG